jgi:hypothetical protein
MSVKIIKQKLPPLGKKIGLNNTLMRERNKKGFHEFQRQETSSSNVGNFMYQRNSSSKAKLLLDKEI